MNTLNENDSASGRTLLWLVYALYLLGITAPIGFVVSGISVWRYKRALSAGEADTEIKLLASHHEWLLRTFIWTLVMAMMALGTIYYMFGFVIAGVAIAWWVYRLVRGINALLQHRAVPSTVCTKDQCYGTINQC